MRLLIAAASLAMASCAAFAQSTPPQADVPTYIKDTFAPTADAQAALGAAITQGTNTPSEWGQGAAGFGRRFASSMGKHIVKRAIHYPLAKLFHEQLSYQRSHKTGFGPRLKYALLGTVITHKTTDGKATVAKAELMSAFGSGLMSRLWQPASTASIGTGFASGGLTLASDAAANVIREFWPEIRHPRGGGRTSAGKAVVAPPSQASPHEH